MAVLEGASVGPATLDPEFIDGFDHGRRFGLWVLPGRGVRLLGSVLAVQPFGDEASLSRRVIVAQALRLAARGWGTLVLDLHGTGDSDGDSADATLATWRSDLLRASRLARSRVPGMHVLWGTRMGALLVADVLPAIESRVDGVVLWQPPRSGEAALDALLRLGRVGAVARASSAPAGSTTGPAGPADAGFVDLGGYRLRDSLVNELVALKPSAPQPSPSRLPCAVLALWLRRSAGAMPAASPDAEEFAREWVAQGYPADARTVAAAPFWSSMEPTDPLAAFDATEDFLAEIAHDA